MQQFAQLSLFEVTVDVAPGVDPAAEGRKLDALIADFIAKGPTADEVLRAATRDVAGRTGALESVGGFGGKAVTLAEGALYSNDPGFYRKQLAQYAATTPDQVRAVMAKWLTRPMHALVVEPGPRGAYEESKSVAAKPATFAPAFYRAPGTESPAQAPRTAVDRSKMPDVGQISDLKFPAVSRAKLSNGVEIVYAQRTATPTTRVVVSFDAGGSDADEETRRDDRAAGAAGDRLARTRWAAPGEVEMEGHGVVALLLGSLVTLALAGVLIWLMTRLPTGGDGR